MAEKYPIFKQLDSMDCGAVCLRMISSFFGKEYALDELRKLTSVDKDGVSLLSISKAAKAIGLESLGVKSNYNRLKEELPLPAIAHWGQNHFVVVYEISDKEVLIADPAEGKRKLSKSEFIANWTTHEEEDAEGILLLLEKTDAFDTKQIELKLNHEDSKAKVTLWSYVYKNPKLWLQLLFGSFLISVLMFLIPFVLKELFDTFYPTKDFDLLNTGLLALLVFGTSIILLELIRHWLINYIAARTNLLFVSDYLKKFMMQPMRFFETKLKWDLLQRVYDNVQIGLFLQTDAIQAAFFILNIIVFCLVFLFFNPYLALIFFLSICLQFLWVYFFQFKRIDSRNRLLETASGNQEILIEMVSGIQEIKLHNTQLSKRANWEEKQTEYFERNKKFVKIDQSQKLGLKVIALLAEVIIIYMSFTYLSLDKISIGTLLAIFYILGQVRTPIVELFDFILKYQDIKTGLERMTEIQEISSPNYKVESLQNLANKHISIEDLDYNYEQRESPYAIKQLNLIIEANKTTAIVGVSGSGKTTLIKIISGLYKPENGRILYGGFHLETINPMAWNEQIGVLFQDSYLFSDSILNNIKMGALDNEALLKESLNITCLDRFIESLPLGLNTLIGEDGIRLSKGQEQQIVLARLIFREPSIICLDEATSALDAVTERQVFANFENYLKDKTTIIVTNRLQTIKNADKIVVLHKGRKLEEGIHDDLIFRKGAYYLHIKNEMGI